MVCLREIIENANEKFGTESTSPARFGPSCNKKEKEEKNIGMAKWKGVRGVGNECHINGHTRKTRAQLVSKRRFKPPRTANRSPLVGANSTARPNGLRRSLP